MNPPADFNGPIPTFVSSGSAETPEPTWQSRVFWAILIGAGTAWLSRAAQLYLSKSPGGDFIWAMKAAHDLWNGLNPYRTGPGSYWFPYPLPSAFAGFPFSFFEPATGAGLFYGLSVGLLTYGLTRRGYSRLLIYTAMPFWFALVWAQWSPLIMAAAFIPELMFTVLMKPHIALPVALTHLTRRGVYICVALLAVSLLINPKWPLECLAQLGPYQRFFPVTTPLGPFLLLALLRWRDRDAWLLLFAAVLPQRHFYDGFVLWLIPKTHKEIALMSIVSWGALIWKIKQQPMPQTWVGFVCVLFFFIPSLIVVLSRPRSQGLESPISSPVIEKRELTVDSYDNQ